MDFKHYLLVFGTVFVAELGDKTQLASFLFASRPGISVLGTFLAASTALVASTALAVMAGSYAAEFVNERYLGTATGLVFIVIGAWTVFRAINS